MNSQPVGPRWNVEEFPSSYNSTPIEWDPDQFDTAAMPFIVAIRQHFWSWRITKFHAGTGSLTVDVAIPSAMPDGFTMIGYDAGDVPPRTLVGEFESLLQAMGSILLDSPWTYRLQIQSGSEPELFEGTFGGSELPTDEAQ